MWFVYVLNVLLIISVVFVERKKPGEALLWAVVLLALPIVGIFLYGIFGSTIWIKLTYHTRSGKISAVYREHLVAQLQQMKHHELALLEHMDSTQRANILFHMNYSDSLLTEHNEVEILTSGKEKYARLFSDLRQAKESIHMVYYGLHNDEVGQELLRILTQKAQEGVQVRVLYDGLGSLATPRGMFLPLIHAGGQAKRIKTLLTHFRNHRKIVVVDGRIAYAGGMNIGKKYLGKHKKKTPWRDTQIRVRGDMVSVLQYFFFYDWLYANPEKRPGVREEDFPMMFAPHDVTQTLPSQVVGSGVETDRQLIKLTYLRLISSASKRIVIQSPYFIPDESMLYTLQLAAASGVEVVFMLPGRQSSFFLEPATNYFISRLLPCGVRVFYYDGYVHAKTLTIDDNITCIGSVNMDIRSLEIDDEICCIFYDEAFNAQHRAVLEEDFSHCRELDYAAFERRNGWERIKERIFLLFSPLM